MKKIIAALFVIASALGVQNLAAQNFTASYLNLETVPPGIYITPVDINPGQQAPIAALFVLSSVLGVQNIGAQNFTASYLNLETVPPGIDITPVDINPGQQAPIAFTDEPWAADAATTGTTILVDGPAYSAGLSKRVVALPPNVSRFTFSYQVTVSEDAALYSQVNETDLIIVDAAGNKFNGSCQLNNEEGGEWQIANAAGDWVDTGFKSGTFVPGDKTQVTVVYQVNWKALTFSVVSITDGRLSFTVPAALQNVAAQQKSGWQPSILDIQIQDGLNALGGSYTRDMSSIDILMQ